MALAIILQTWEAFLLSKSCMFLTQWSFQNKDEMEGKKKAVLFLQDKTKALELSKQGLCSKKICEILNCGKTQINNLLKRKHEI